MHFDWVRRSVQHKQIISLAHYNWVNWSAQSKGQKISTLWLGQKISTLRLVQTISTLQLGY